jgi:hypothetical protein
MRRLRTPRPQAFGAGRWRGVLLGYAAPDERVIESGVARHFENPSTSFWSGHECDRQ